MTRASIQHYQRQQRLVASVVRAVRVLWGRMGNDFDASWRQVGPRMVQVVTAGQLAAANTVPDYLDEVLRETRQQAPPVPSSFDRSLLGEDFDFDPDHPLDVVDLDRLAVDLDIPDLADLPPAELLPEAFAGVASGGGDLEGLLEQAVVRTKVAYARPDPGQPGRYGVPLPTEDNDPFRRLAALEAGQRFLDTAVATEVQDAQRNATRVGMAIRPKVTGYIRVLNLPSCSRCVLLAGKWFRYDADFPRHPGCDCLQEPAPEVRSDTVATVPERAYAAGLVTGLRAVDRQAIDDGADFGQVVNSRRGGGMSADGLWTREGTSRRGVASKVIRANDRAAVETTAREFSRTQRRVRRPTVDAIYRYAEDREDAINLLRLSGYIV